MVASTAVFDDLARFERQVEEEVHVMRPHIRVGRARTQRVCARIISKFKNASDSHTQLGTMKTSYEPKRSSAYSEDLRWRMVWQREALGYTYEQISKNLGVDSSTVQRTVALFNATGSVQKRAYPKERAFRKLTPIAQLFILNLVLEKPGIHLHEIQRELEASLLLAISLSTLCTFLHKCGFTHKKLRTVALQQDRMLREQFSSEVSVFNTEMFVFVNETGSDARNKLRKKGYSIRGKPARYQTFLLRGERISAIACMSSAGLLDVKTFQGTANGETFYNFVQTHLLPHLMPYNGINPHSVVVLDNCSIHHLAEVIASIEDVGALVLFLPPYSPDLNPIEELFSKVKTTLKSFEFDMAHITDLQTLLLSSFTSVTVEDCNGWIAHCDIYT